MEGVGIPEKAKIDKKRSKEEDYRRQNGQNTKMEDLESFVRK